MRYSRAARLIAWAWFTLCGALLLVPLVHASVTAGAPSLPPLFRFCDLGFAGDLIPEGHANLTLYCTAIGASKTEGMNKVCSLHGSSYSPPGTDVGGAGSFSGAHWPGGENPQRYIDCAGTGSGNKVGRWLRNCPSTTVPGAYSNVWKSVQAAGGTAACPEPPPPPNECGDKDGTVARGPAYFSIGGDATGRPPSTACYDGCLAVFEGESPAGRRLDDGGGYEYFAKGLYRFKGDFQCSSGDEPDSVPSIPPDECPPGKVLGTDPATGKKQCLDPSTDEPDDPNPDECPAWCGCGTKTKTNPDGSTESTVTTWDGDTGKCTKTTTSDPDGPGGPLPPGPPGTEEEEKPPGSGEDGDPEGPNPDPMDEICKKNPDLEMCKDTSFSGTCSEEGPTAECEGDAIQCAIAKATSEISCRFKPTSTTITEILEASGLDGKETALKASLNESTFDVSTMLKGNSRDLTGACPAPFTGSVLGASFEIDVTPFCTLAGILGLLLMISATVISARVIAGGV